MSFEPDVEAGPAEKRGWLLSPAVATLIFFAAQLFIAELKESPREVRAATAAAEAPRVPVEVRVVSQIRPLGADTQPSASVPKSERELLQLFEKQGCVVFSSAEVEDIDTLEREFGADEVGVITADKLRRARFAR